MCSLHLYMCGNSFIVWFPFFSKTGMLTGTYVVVLYLPLAVQNTLLLATLLPLFVLTHDSKTSFSSFIHFLLFYSICYYKKIVSTNNLSQFSAVVLFFRLFFIPAFWGLFLLLAYHCLYLHTVSTLQSISSSSKTSSCLISLCNSLFSVALWNLFSQLMFWTLSFSQFLTYIILVHLVALFHCKLVTFSI